MQVKFGCVILHVHYHNDLSQSLFLWKECTQEALWCFVRSQVIRKATSTTMREPIWIRAALVHAAREQIRHNQWVCKRELLFLKAQQLLTAAATAAFTLKREREAAAVCWCCAAGPLCIVRDHCVICWPGSNNTVALTLYVADDHCVKWHQSYSICMHLNMRRRHSPLSAFAGWKVAAADDPVRERERRWKTSRAWRCFPFRCQPERCAASAHSALQRA